MTLKSFAQKLKSFLKAFLFTILCIVYLFLTIWTFCYSLNIFYVFIIVLAIGLILYFRRKKRRDLSAILVVGLIIFLIATPYNLTQYNNNAAGFQARVNRGKSLTFKEKCGIYGNVLMIIVLDYIPLREASVMNFYMLFPKENKTRVFYSNAYLRAHDIQPLLNKKGKNTVAWNKWNERLNGNFRFAAAFDPCTIEITDEGTYKKAVLITPFQYRKNYTTKNAVHAMHGLFEFHINEGLFWYLQHKGWLHPYTAVWIAKFDK
ncbi:hypothetical protein ACFOG5_22575 [Pedobacter fastidiosus]|uniref:DUF4105 domain-containing protein n=1 Tax=Pedobacter fastidiosus TaxID=2765361 RepID=A0ABR7KTJ6_9SPHI|nr:hypothetical protein [Pedobacter fastidiosus]MBC6111381.1 hypothetical protein [Pedobacter fastidiosus]